MSYSFHHGLHTRATYDSQESTKRLRANPWLIMPLDEQTHRELHREIPTIPLLSPQMGMLVLREFEPVQGNYVASMYALMGTIGEAIKHPRAKPIEKAIGELTIDALELQIPYMQEGLVDVPYVVSATRTRDFQQGRW